MAANGDTANKIGTYQIAIVAKHHGVPFYIAAPSSSVDLSISSGHEIVIEERPQVEMTCIAGVPVTANGLFIHLHLSACPVRVIANTCGYAICRFHDPLTTTCRNIIKHLPFTKYHSETLLELNL